MIKTLLSRNIRHLRTPFVSSNTSYQSARAASVKSGIARGLRKSKGVGFRGRERGAGFEKKDYGPNIKTDGFSGRGDDTTFEKKGFKPREKPAERNDFMRRTSDQRGFTNRPQMSREGWPGRAGIQAPQRVQEARIYKGVKAVKTDLQLARKKPNPAGSSHNGGYISGAQSVDRALSSSKREPTRYQRRKSAGRRPQSSFEGRDRTESTNSRSYDARDQSDMTNKHPSLSFGKPKLPRQHTEPDVTKRLPDRERRLHTGGSNEHEQGSKTRQRQSHFEERNFERRPTDSTNTYTQRSSTKGATANAFRRRGPDDKIDSGKFDEDSSTTRPRFTNTIDSRTPLSVTYTTPASEFLYGTSVVEAALRSTRIPRRQHYKFYICAGENRENTKKDADMERLARYKQVEVVKMSGDGLRLMDKMSSGRPHNGYILEASPLPRLPITSMGKVTTKDGQFGFEVGVESQSREEAAVNGTSNFVRIPIPRGGRKPMVLLLDSIVDPVNLGGIMRTASFLGVSAVAISAQGGGNFSPVVLKASAGASENLPIFHVNDPTGFARDSKQAGWKVYAAVAPRPSSESFKPVSSVSTDELLDPLAEDPCILMVGGEGDGLPKFLRSKADVEIHIPSRGGNHTVNSLNVNVATGILCDAFLTKNTVVRPPTEGQIDPQKIASSDRLF